MLAEYTPATSPDGSAVAVTVVGAVAPARVAVSHSDPLVTCTLRPVSVPLPLPFVTVIVLGSGDDPPGVPKKLNDEGLASIAGAAITSTVASSVTPKHWAWISAWPSCSAWAMPLLEIEATCGFKLVQVTSAGTGLPPSSRQAAENCCVWSCSRLTDSGEIDTLVMTT
jgi:hypothetical protein